MATGRALFQAHVDGTMLGEALPVQLEWLLSAAIGEVDILTLANGWNSLTAPTGTNLIVFVPPSANTVSITLKGVTGDTGIALSKNNPTILSVSGTAWGVTAGGSIAGCLIAYL